jgi:cardiolipin synthase
MHIGASLLVMSHCLKTRKEASSALLWMFLSWMLPVIGPLMYLSFGVNRVHDKGFRKHVADQKLLAMRRAREDDCLPLAYWRSVHEAVRGEPDSEFDRQLNRAMNSLIPDHPMLGGNEISTLVDGAETYPRMLDAIRHAKHHVHLQSFIIANDTVGRQFMDLLKEKAEAGVLVRVMFDRFGSTRAFLSGFFRPYERIRNMRIVGWTQANILKRQFQLNLRNHRKVLVIDGQHAFCGGINLCKDNIAEDERQSIRDYHFEIRGPMVQELQYTFMRDWYFMTEEDPESLLQEVYYPRIQPSGKSMMRLVNSGPTSEMARIADVFFMCITAADKQVLIATPYFVPTPDIVRAMRTAALRGVDVKLVVPQKNNHVYAGLAGCALYEELMEAGVRIFERRPPFTHAKALIVDDTYAVVGTANLDVRSLRLNYETNIAVSSDEFVEELKCIVLDDIALSDEIRLNVWRNRSASRQLAENFCSLLTPIL